MKFNPKIHPDRDAIVSLLKSYPKDKPAVMLNLLRFRDKALEGTETGEEACKRYGENAFEHVKKANEKMLYKVKVFKTLSANHDDSPNEILMVQYPSVQHFDDMVSTKEYAAISEDRTIALEFGGLIACDTEYSMLDSK
ncbi:MAG: DUF1330 domain-containing protein [Saprospiraceae bacterium]|nr:DUF1330 domain-containing protein [Saprospiraceae bacterium]|tara:strand:- start:5001 stop:5417 length:417 start_codon:yes stop_codon:yes gene_type:complete